MIKVVGFQVKNGIFEDEKGRNISYDNVILHYTSDQNPDVHGLEVNQLKIKRDQFNRICSVSAADLLNKEIAVSYTPVAGKLQLSQIVVLK